MDQAASCTTTTAASCKRKAAAGHPDAPPPSRRQNFNQDENALARLAAGQVVEHAVAKEPVKIDSAETEDSLLHGDRPASKNGGSTRELPIVIGDDIDGLPCQEEETAAPWPKDNTLISPFGYKTWDPTDGGRYELLSTYVPPPCLDPDEEDALWWLAAVYTAPDLYTSPADVFWGTPDGVWTAY